ncbi:MAG TPA: lipid-binding SYLF domain-containing protein [Rudaea sp.]|nr:lipid-binding SYLF domain-containing protein [Rudaea sp.]
MQRWQTMFFALFSLLLVAAAPARAGEQEVERANNAVRVLKEIMMAPDKRIPADLLDHATAVAVIPDVIKAGFVIGGRHGVGMVSIKTADGTWSNPSFVSMTGGSIGFQAGVQSTDVVLVFRTQRGVDSIVHGKFTLGADASVAAGPVGRNAQAATDAQLKAEIYSYSRSRGLFAGVSLDGSVLAIDNDANQAVYGEGVTPRRIFAGGVSNVPDAVVDFRDRLEEYTAH